MLFNWPIRAIIFEIRAGNIFVVFDKAKRKVNNRGESVYVLKAKKAKTRPSRYKDVMLSKKGKNVIALVSPSPTEFYPIDPNKLAENNELTPIKEDLKFWLAEQVKSAHDMWQSRMSMLMKFIPAALIGVTVIGIMLLLYITFQGMVELSASLGGIATNLGQVSDNLLAAMGATQGTITPSVFPPSA